MYVCTFVFLCVCAECQFKVIVFVVVFVVEANTTTLTLFFPLSKPSLQRGIDIPAPSLAKRKVAVVCGRLVFCWYVCMSAFVFRCLVGVFVCVAV